MASDQRRRWPGEARPLQPTRSLRRRATRENAEYAEPAERHQDTEVDGSFGITDSTPPVVEAYGLGKHGRKGWVYRDADLVVPDGGVGAVVGEPGTGRSSLLLTISGRMRPSAGEVRVAGFRLPRRGRRVRRLVSVARIGGAVELEDQLTVRGALTERRSLEGVPAKRAEATFDDSWTLVGLDVDPYTLVADLTAVDHARLALALALLTDPVLVVLDDIDAGVRTSEQRELWRRARAVASTGVSVVASTVDVTAAYGLLDAALPLREAAPAADEGVTDVADPERGVPRTGLPRPGGQP